MRIKKMSKCLTSCVLAIVTVASLSGCNSAVNPDDYIELGQYKGLEVEKATHQVTEEEIEDELFTLASAYATNEVVEKGSVRTGDVANIDYVGKLDGVAFDGGTASGYDLEIGSGKFISGFEDGLVGVKIGDTVDLNLTFPENYGNSELAGQDVIFTVTVNEVQRQTVPEVTDDFINEISAGKYKSVEAYTKDLEDEIISEYEQYNELQYYEDLWNLAVDNASIKKEFPGDLVNEKVSKMIVEAQKYAISYGMNYNDFIEQYFGMDASEFNSNAGEYAKQALKETLVMQAIAKKENITVSQEEIDAAIDEYVELGSYKSREDFIEQNDMDDLEEYVLLSKIEDFLAENAAK